MSRPIDDLPGDLGAMSPPPVGTPSFTVIVRTQGNRPGSLAEALASLAAQTHYPFDVVVVVHDDDPETAPRVESLARNTILPEAVRFISVVGGGRSRPLNVGLTEATSDYVCFLDDDDLAMPDWLAAFARALSNNPGSVVRSVTQSQAWTTDGGVEPARAVGPIERPFAQSFDLLAHFSHNETPICSIALPLELLRSAGITFDESLPVYEDWDLLMRVAMLAGVVSIPDETSLYRRLDDANADSAETVAIWEATHTKVLDRLSAGPLVLPAGDARRLASAHFDVGGGSRHDRELVEARQEIDELTRSPVRWAARFAKRVTGAANARLSARRR
jgi:glycosyltransferase involved in cell wall biosynthesis